jgi:biopolymer transport protein ExbD
MSMSIGAKRGGVVAEINVTPMADVMIVLLIIFMVATPLFVTSPVPLPRATEATSRKGDDLKIVVKAHGEISIGNATFGDVAALGAFVREQVAAAGDRRSVVLVQADRDASYREVARVIEACRAAGAEEIGLAAERKVGR